MILGKINEIIATMKLEFEEQSTVEIQVFFCCLKPEFVNFLFGTLMLIHWYNLTSSFLSSMFTFLILL